MNEDTLRRAVELADGWDVSSGGVVTVIVPEQDDSSGWWLDELPQYAKDALAAQLVRRVDAMDIEIRPIIGHASTIVETITYKSPDRTENTINACVAFLEQSDE